MADVRQDYMFTNAGKTASTKKPVKKTTKKKVVVKPTANKSVLAKNTGVDKTVLSGQGTAGTAAKSVLSGTAAETPYANKAPLAQTTPAQDAQALVQQTAVQLAEKVAQETAAKQKSQAEAIARSNQLANTAEEVRMREQERILNEQKVALAQQQQQAQIQAQQPGVIPQSTIPTTEQQVQQGSATPAGTVPVQQQEAPPATASPNTGVEETPVYTPPAQVTTTPVQAPTKAGQGTTPTTGAQTPTTGTEAPTTTLATPQDVVNPYLAQLSAMKFDYNPVDDPDYVETAGALENQVAQMMVGRGGLWSSVAQSATQARLITLQNDMRAQKYTEFQGERNFVMTMAKYISDLQAQAFSQDMQTKSYNLSVQQAQFNQQMATAEYNLKVQAQQFSQSMQMANYRLSAANAAYNKQIASAAQKQSAQQAAIRTQATRYQLEIGKYDELKAQWAKTGKANAQVAAFFRVEEGLSYSKSSPYLVAKNTAYQVTKDNITSQMLNYNMDEEALTAMYEFYTPTEYEKLYGTTAPVEPQKTGTTSTTTYQKDASGQVISQTTKTADQYANQTKVGTWLNNLFK